MHTVNDLFALRQAPLTSMALAQCKVDIGKDKLDSVFNEVPQTK